MRNFETYCKDYENVENYEKAKKDDFKGWCCHHRKGEFIPTEELMNRGMYYNVSAEELIFLTRSEHQVLHMKGKQYHKGKKHSDETKKKLSKPKSDETKQKMSETAQNMSASHRNKLSEAKKGNTNVKGYHWYNNGKTNIMSKECPLGYVPGMLKRK